MDALRWCRAFARRVEAQYRRAWTLGFALWNYMFRTLLNTRRNIYTHARRSADAATHFSFEKIEEAAMTAAQRVEAQQEREARAAERAIERACDRARMRRTAGDVELLDFLILVFLSLAIYFRNSGYLRYGQR